MNAPFKLPDAKQAIIEEILATATVSISDLKKNPAAVVAEAKLRQVAILNRNRPVAYMIAPHVWEYLCDLVTDNRLMAEAQDELAQSGGEEIEVDLDDYL